MRVHDVDRHLGRVPVEGLLEHLEMDVRVLVAGEADEAHLARLARLEGRPQAALLEHPVGIVVVDHLMELPQVEVIGTEAPQAVVQAPLRALVVPLAVLGHEEDLLPSPVLGQRASHQLLGAPVVVVPGVVEERDSLVEGGVHQSDRLRVVLDRSDVPAAEREDRDALARAAQDASGKPGSGGGARLGEHLFAERRQGGSDRRLLEEVPPGGFLHDKPPVI